MTHCYFQPILNASILDNVIRHERNIPSEVASAENYAELQVTTCVKEFKISRFILIMLVAIMDDYVIYQPIGCPLHLRRHRTILDFCRLSAESRKLITKFFCCIWEYMIAPFTKYIVSIIDYKEEKGIVRMDFSGHSVKNGQ